MAAAAPKSVFAVAVNPSIGKNEELMQLIENAEFYAALDMFLTGIVKNADVVLPVRSVLETDGTAVSIDGRLLRMKKVVQSPINSKSNLEIAHILGDYFRKKIDKDAENVFKQIAVSLGFNVDDYKSAEELYRVKEKIFNKTEYIYTKPDIAESIVYVNPRHHEGVLTKMIFASEENYPNFPEIEKYISPGYIRSGNMLDNIAKGVKLIPR